MLTELIIQQAKAKAKAAGFKDLDDAFNHIINKDFLFKKHHEKNEERKEK